MIISNLQYAVILTLLVICEIAGGIAAAVKKGEVSLHYHSPYTVIGLTMPTAYFQLEGVLIDSANSTLRSYYNDSSKGRAWDTFQTSVSQMPLSL